MADEDSSDAQLSRRKDQLDYARDRSIAIRKRRAELKRLIKADGPMDSIRLVAGGYPEWEEDIATWRLEQLLKSIPYIGDATRAEIYAVGKFSPRQTLQALSPTRRRELARLCEQGQRGIPAAVRERMARRREEEDARK
jgi:hypothetical protein